MDFGAMIGLCQIEVEAFKINWIYIYLLVHVNGDIQLRKFRNKIFFVRIKEGATGRLWSCRNQITEVHNNFAIRTDGPNYSFNGCIKALNDFNLINVCCLKVLQSYAWSIRKRASHSSQLNTELYGLINHALTSSTGTKWNLYPVTKNKIIEIVIP